MVEYVLFIRIIREKVMHFYFIQTQVETKDTQQTTQLFSFDLSSAFKCPWKERL